MQFFMNFTNRTEYEVRFPQFFRIVLNTNVTFRKSKNRIEYEA